MDLNSDMHKLQFLFFGLNLFKAQGKKTHSYPVVQKVSGIWKLVWRVKKILPRLLRGACMHAALASLWITK